MILLILHFTATIRSDSWNVTLAVDRDVRDFVFRDLILIFINGEQSSSKEKNKKWSFFKIVVHDCRQNRRTNRSMDRTDSCLVSIDGSQAFSNDQSGTFSFSIDRSVYRSIDVYLLSSCCPIFLHQTRLNYWLISLNSSVSFYCQSFIYASVHAKFSSCRRFKTLLIGYSALYFFSSSLRIIKEFHSF